VWLFAFHLPGLGGALNEIKLFIPLWVLLVVTFVALVGVAIVIAIR
jgi:hypothetical protein